MDANPDESKFTYSRPNDVFNFTVLAENMSEFFVANPEETDVPADQPAVVSALDGVINDSEYTESYAITADNFKAWTTAPDMNGKEFKYYFNMKSDGLYVGVKAKGANAGDLIQLNFNPGDKLAAVPGLFLSFKLGDTLTVLQHNHKTAVLADDSAGGADITDKIENKIVKTDDGYDFEVKLPVELFTITDVDGADSFKYGEDPLYYGMFAVVGGQGYTNQTNTPASDWSCNGLGLKEYSLVIAQPQTGDVTVAMFAVIMILALSAAIVFAKKKSF
jgi:LPXTG-motif cell wall-anchored protein